MNNKGISRIYYAFGYSALGFKAVYRHEAAFRQELFLAAFLIPLAYWLDVDSTQRIMMISVLLLVLIVELLNSAIEAVVDRIGLEQHELSGRAKDMGSAAVFMSLTLTTYVWGAVLWQLFGID